MLRDFSFLLLTAAMTLFGQLGGCDVRGHLDGSGRQSVTWPWSEARPDGAPSTSEAEEP